MIAFDEMMSMITFDEMMSDIYHCLYRQRDGDDTEIYDIYRTLADPLELADDLTTYESENFEDVKAAEEKAKRAFRERLIKIADRCEKRADELEAYGKAIDNVYKHRTVAKFLRGL